MGGEERGGEMGKSPVNKFSAHSDACALEAGVGGGLSCCSGFGSGELQSINLSSDD